MNFETEIFPCKVLAQSNEYLQFYSHHLQPFLFSRREKWFDISLMISKPFLALKKHLKESKRVAYDANRTVQNADYLLWKCTKNLQAINFQRIFHRIHANDLSELDGWTKPTNVTPTLVAKGCPVYTSKFHFYPNQFLFHPIQFYLTSFNRSPPKPPPRKQPLVDRIYESKTQLLNDFFSTWIIWHNINHRNVELSFHFGTSTSNWRNCWW